MNKARDTGLALLLILLLCIFYKSGIRLGYVAIFVLVLIMSVPIVFRPLSPIWFGFANVLGKVGSTLIFSAIFFIVATPIGLFRRIIGKDAMGFKKWGKKEATAFITKNHTYSKKDLEKPF